MSKPQWTINEFDNRIVDLTVRKVLEREQFLVADASGSVRKTYQVVEDFSALPPTALQRTKFTRNAPLRIRVRDTAVMISSEEWSRQLRAKVKASEQADRERDARLCGWDPGDP